MVDRVPTSTQIKEAIVKSLNIFPDINDLKPEQKLIVENVVLGKDVFAALPTGFGKSLTFQILPSVYKALHSEGFDVPPSPLVIVVSPLSSIVRDQVAFLRSLGLKATFIGESDKQDKDIIEGNANAQLLYGSPEAFVGEAKFREMFSTPHYRQNVVAVVCDEVHTVIHWGEKNDQKEPFRKWCGLVGEIRSLLPQHVPVLALTATASALTRKKIMKSLSLNRCLEIVVSPNRKNIKLFVLKVTSDICINFMWLAKELDESRIRCPRTLIYVRDYATCGELYQFFMGTLLDRAYYPDGAEKKSANRMVSMYHSSTSPAIQKHVLQSLKDPDGKVRIVIATNALGMGVDIKGLHNVINYGPPCDLESYVQEMGRAGRDGQPSEALLLFHGRQLRLCKPEMLQYVKSTSCRRKQILAFFEDATEGSSTSINHLCCDVCAQKCDCGQECPQNLGSMASKLSLQPSADVQKTRSVNQDERRALEVLLRECQESLREEVLKSNPHCFVSNIDQVTCFTNCLIEKTVSKCDFLFSIDDIVEQTPVLSVQHAFKVYDCLCKVFTDLQKDKTLDQP